MQVVGTVVGYYYGGPAGAQVGSTIGAWIDRNVLGLYGKDEVLEGPRLDSINVQSAAYGIGIPVVYGTMKMAGNIIWAGPIQEVITVKDGESLAEYLASFAVLLCEGVIQGITRIWANDLLMTDLRETPIGRRVGGGPSLAESIAIYYGTEDQEPDPTIAAWGLEGNFVPAYRGRAYVVFKNFKLKYTNNSIPNLLFELSTDVTQSVPFDPIDISPDIASIDSSNPFQGAIYMLSGAETDRYEYARLPSDSNVTGAVEWDTHFPHGGGRAGKKCLKLPGDFMPAYVAMRAIDPSYLGLDGETNSPRAWGSFWFMIPVLPVAGIVQLAALQSGGTNKISVAVDSLGQVWVFGTNDVFKAISQPGAIGELGVYHRMDFRQGQGEGPSYVVLIDNVIVAEYEGGGSTADIASLVIGSETGSSIAWYADDFVLTTGFMFPPGEYYIQAMMFEHNPNASGWFTYSSDPDGDNEIFPPAAFYPDGLNDVPCNLHIDYIKGSTSGLNASLPCQTINYVNTIYATKTHVVTQRANGSQFPGGNIHLQIRYALPGEGVQISGTAQVDDSWGGKAKIDRLNHIANPPYWTKDELNEALSRGDFGVKAPFGPSPRVSQFSVHVLHGTIAPTLTPGPAQDNLVVYPDETRVLIEAYGNWDIFNLLTNEVDHSVDHFDPDVGRAAIPFDDCDFDIDENSVVYTCGTISDSDLSVSHPMKLSGETLTVYAVSQVDTYYPTMVRVSRNPLYPYLAIFGFSNQRLNILDRSTLDWFGLDTQILSAPVNYYFSSMDWDEDTGRLWVVANDTATDSSTVFVVTPNPGTTPTILEFSIFNDASGAARVLRWDRDTQQLMIGAKPESGIERILFYTYNEEDSTLANAGQATGEVVPLRAKSAWRRGAVNGEIFYAYDQGDSTIHRFSVSGRTVTKTWLTDEMAGTTPTWDGGCVYDKFAHSIVTGCDLPYNDNVYVRVWLDRGDPNSVLLSEIVADVCERVSVTAAERDVSDLVTTTIRGYLLDHRMRARSAIERLADGYFFDCVESDGKLKFPIRGKPPVVTIPYEHLAAHTSGSGRPQAVTTTRQQELEMPRAVEIGYIDWERTYERGVQRSSRQITTSREVVVIDIPVAMTADEAAQIAEKRLSFAWAQRTSQVVSVPFQYAWLDAADVVVVEEPDSERVIRIDRLTYSGGVIEIEAANEVATAYESTASGVPGPLEEPQGELPGLTRMVLVNSPLISPIDDAPGLYVAMRGYMPEWTGARIDISRDGGSSWTPWATQYTQSPIASAISALPPVGDPNLWDEVSTVTVKFVSQTFLSSRSALQVLNGANPLLVGNELIAYRSALDLGENRYTLSGLLRGRKGTEWAMSTHEIGESCVYFHSDFIKFHGLTPSDNGYPLWFRPVSLGPLGMTGAPQQFTPQMRHLMPLSADHVTGERDGAENLTVTWTPRGRIAGEWDDLSETPVGEVVESYEVDITDGEDVLRTIASSTPSVGYSAAEQTSDGLTPGNLVTVLVYQLNAVVGRGFASEATV